MKVYAVWYDWYNGEEYEDIDYDGDVLKIFLNKEAATEFVTNLTADELLSFDSVPSDYDERRGYEGESWIEKVPVDPEPPSYYYNRVTKEYIEITCKPIVKFCRRHSEIDDGKWHLYPSDEEWSLTIREWEVEE